MKVALIMDQSFNHTSEDSRAPITCPNARHSLAEKRTLPATIKIISAPILLVIFINRVIPEAVSISRPKRINNAAVQTEPVPGPEKPSLKPHPNPNRKKNRCCDIFGLAILYPRFFDQSLPEMRGCFPHGL